MAIILNFYCVFNTELREFFERERYCVYIDVDVGEILASEVTRICYKRCLSDDVHIERG